MAKSHKIRRVKKSRKQRKQKKTRKQRGGYEPEEKETLLGFGFTEPNIQRLEGHKARTNDDGPSIVMIQGFINRGKTPKQFMEQYDEGSDETDNEYDGGRKNRKRKNKRKTRKQRGGMCYGRGVGANSYDPNYSIFNTSMLKLFPYKPTN